MNISEKKIWILIFKDELQIEVNRNETISSFLGTSMLCSEQKWHISNKDIEYYYTTNEAMILRNVKRQYDGWLLLKPEKRLRYTKSG